MGTSTKELARKLEESISSQGGFFTAAQAVSAGYADSVHAYHMRNGDWERAGRGIYRLRSCPPPRWPELHVLLLWSRGKNGKPQGVFCRETALMIRGFSKQTGKSVHMTVPRDFRRNSQTPNELCLYYESIDPDDFEVIGGLPVTTTPKSFADSGAARTKPKIIQGETRFDLEEEGELGSVVALKPGEWSPGVTFYEAIERGED